MSPAGVQLILCLMLCLFCSTLSEVYLPQLFSRSGKPDRVKESLEEECEHPSLRGLPQKLGLIQDIGHRDAVKTLLDRHKVNFTSCAVVGNAGILRATRYGAVIDSHSVVMRLNVGPTTNYEQYVGSKGTFRILNKEYIPDYAKGKDLPKENGMFLVARGDKEVRVKRGRYTSVLNIPDTRKKVLQWSKKSGIQVLQYNKKLSERVWDKIKHYEKCTDTKRRCNACKVTRLSLFFWT